MAKVTPKQRIKDLLLKLGISLFIGLIVVSLTHVFRFGLIQDIDFLTIDYRFQQRGAGKDIREGGDVVIVKISDEDTKALPGGFPFPRSYYAHVIENLNRAGARVIAIDLTFATEAEGDSVLRALLEKTDNVVLGVKAATGGTTERYEIRSREQRYDNVFYDVNRQVGVVHVPSDRDGAVRRYLPMFNVEDFLTPTLAFAALNRYYGEPPGSTVSIQPETFVFQDRAIPRYDPTSFMLNYYGPVESFRYVPFSHVIDDERFWTQDELDIEEQLNTFDENTMKLFKDKIVLIGSTMAEERDYHTVPIPNPIDGGRLMHGVEIHATAIQNVIDQNFIRHADPTFEMGLIFALAIVSFFVIHWFKRLRLRHVVLLEIGALVIVVLFMGAVFEYAILSFSNANTLVSVVNPSLAIILAYVGTIVHQYLAERQQKALIRSVFSHYINPSVVNELIANPEKATLGGDKRELTVFFSDIAGFTSISEQLAPEELVLLLNEYLEEMTRIIFRYEGTLDKYEGDAIMAFWGAPIPQQDHALRTCRAALDMQKRLTVLRTKWKKEGKPAIEVRCGINTGVMIVGNMGGQERFDYTVIGDSVNLASRLEGANKQYGSNIMISEFTHEKIKNAVTVRELDLIQVKGKTEPVKVFELLGLSDLQMNENQKQSLELYQEGLKLYRERKFEEAAAYMEQAMKFDPECRAAQIYIERSQLYRITPPPSEWNGVFVMTTK
ncbi:MAG: CHASE2 domain-containing protein [Ignavibacteria bacterium]|nr:CHASE2 domain-containing protein [Ignavibacteria bacterium]